MNCHRARMAIVERDAGLLTLGFERALDDHLAGCAVCRRSAARERLLVAGLAALRGAEAPAVDVRERVLENLEGTPRIERGWVAQGQLAWASAAAVAAALGLVAWIWPHAAWLREAAATVKHGTLALLSAAYSTLAALKGLLVLPWRVAAALGDAATPWLESLARLEPLASTAVALGLLAMMLTIAWIVGNDLRRPLPVAWRNRE